MTKRRTVAIDHTHEPATEQYDGFMSFDDKKILKKVMFLDGSNSKVVELTFSNGTVITIDEDKQITNIAYPDGTTANIPSELWYSQGKATESIAEGDNVMLAGSQGDHYLVKKAVSSELEANPELYLGVATKASAINEWVKITKWGLVNNIDMNSWAYGTTLYYNPLNGWFTPTIPSLPSARIKVGMVVKTGTNTGILLVDIANITLYTNAEIDSLLAGKSNTGHTHDDRYYTESEIDAFLASKQATLVSGTNIKTINGASILGSGDLSVSATVDWSQVFNDSSTYRQYMAKGGSPTGYMRTSSNGLIPSSNGSGGVGTSTWRFASMYANEFFQGSGLQPVLSVAGAETGNPRTLKLSDGTIIKSGTATVTTAITATYGGGFYVSSTVTITFDATYAFSVAPSVSVFPVGAVDVSYLSVSVSTTNFVIKLMKYGSTASASYSIYYNAIGR